MGFLLGLLRRRAKATPLEASRQLLEQHRHLEARAILDAWLPTAPLQEVPRAKALFARACLALNLDAQAARATAEGLAINDSTAELHLVAGLCRRRTGDQTAAESAFRRCLTLDPASVEATVALCELLCSTARASEALALVTGELQQSAADRRLLFASANVHVELGRLDDARACLHRFLEGSADHPEALMNLGVIESKRGRDALALDHFRAALRVKPGDPEISLHLAASLGRAGRHAEGIAVLEPLELDDERAPRIFSLLAELHAKAGDVDKAQLCCAKAATLDLSNPGHYLLLGHLLLHTDRVFEAIGALNKSLAIRETPAANRRLGAGLLRAFRPAEAAVALEAAQREMPDDVETSVLLNVARRSSLNCSPAEHLEECRRLVAENPHQGLAHSSLLFSLSFDADTSPEAYLAQAVKFGDSLQGVATMGAVYEQHLDRRPASRPLRLGFVSADFHNHPVGFFFEALVAEIDTDKYQLFGYANSPKSDELTRRIQSRFASWELVRTLEDRKLAELIHSHRLDILFDLSGHTANHRLSMFAYRPAPIQATWLGYWASTGLPAMDYVVADPLSVPLEHEHHFCERVIRMPVTRLCYGSSLPEQPGVAPAPSVANGFVTFGCFQALHKIEAPVVAAWRRILEAAPDCRLRIRSLQFADPTVLQTARERWLVQGLPADRLELLPPLPQDVYLQAYSEVDVALDTFPYPGGTTTAQALWMGVPTITMEGGTMLSRQGMALMSAAGMQEWVTHSVDDYVKLALDVCADPSRVANMRQSIRHTVKASPLFDARRFARDFEDMLERMMGDCSRKSDRQSDTPVMFSLQQPSIPA
jgi:predicted O-linked N-acetylglucosamine transferase (SPINDLY family)